MRYFLSLGSNKGHSFNFIKTAVKELKKIGEVLKLSSVYKTSPVGEKSQSDFLNIILEFEFDGAPPFLLEKIKDLELRLGRSKSYHWGPREIDIDIIEYDGPILSSEKLSVPHVEMNNRKFVLVPLQEISPKYLSRNKKTINQLIAECAGNEKVEILKMDKYGAGWI